jgi:Zn-dependent M28 family amino/carboxypeptidase
VRRPEALAAAADRLVAALAARDLKATRQEYTCEGQTVANIEVALSGAPGLGTLVVGAHYDSADGTPGADDNASGVAALLELALRLSARHAADAGFPRHTLRLVCFVNEEPPYFQTEAMGSLVHARALAARGETVSAMLAFDSLAYYDDRAGSQHYPFPFSLAYPDTANFLGFVGDLGSGELVRHCVASFRASGALPSEGVATFGALEGIGWSDHWSYWQIGTPAVMVTDTALFRNPNYHEPTDTPDTLDYDRLARAVDGIEAVVVAMDVDNSKDP